MAMGQNPVHPVSIPIPTKISPKKWVVHSPTNQHGIPKRFGQPQPCACTDFRGRGPSVAPGQVGVATMHLASGACESASTEVAKIFGSAPSQADTARQARARETCFSCSAAPTMFPLCFGVCPKKGSLFFQGSLNN